MKIRQQRTIEKNICKKMILLSFCMILMVSMEGCGNKRKENLTITNVSYDPTREFYEKYNKDFIKYYKDKYGKKVEVIQSHGGSGSQHTRRTYMKAHVRSNTSAYGEGLHNSENRCFLPDATQNHWDGYNKQGSVRHDTQQIPEASRLDYSLPKESP